jgi:hypothetical protein
MNFASKTLYNGDTFTLCLQIYILITVFLRNISLNSTEWMNARVAYVSRIREF